MHNYIHLTYSSVVRLCILPLTVLIDAVKLAILHFLMMKYIYFDSDDKFLFLNYFPLYRYEFSGYFCIFWYCGKIRDALLYLSPG